MNEDQKERERAKLSQQILELRECQPLMLELQEINARATRHKFLALVREGFTPQQALDLCKEWKA